MMTIILANPNDMQHDWPRRPSRLQRYGTASFVPEPSMSQLCLNL